MLFAFGSKSGERPRASTAMLYSLMESAWSSKTLPQTYCNTLDMLAACANVGEAKTAASSAICFSRLPGSAVLVPPSDRTKMLIESHLDSDRNVGFRCLSSSLPRQPARRNSSTPFLVAKIPQALDIRTLNPVCPDDRSAEVPKRFGSWRLNKLAQRVRESAGQLTMGDCAAAAPQGEPRSPRRCCGQT